MVGDEKTVQADVIIWCPADGEPLLTVERAPEKQLIAARVGNRRLIWLIHSRANEDGLHTDLGTIVVRQWRGGGRRNPGRGGPPQCGVRAGRGGRGVAVHV